MKKIITQEETDKFNEIIDKCEACLDKSDVIELEIGELEFLSDFTCKLCDIVRDLSLDLDELHRGVTNLRTSMSTKKLCRLFNFVSDN